MLKKKITVARKKLSYAIQVQQRPGQAGWSEHLLSAVKVS